MLIKYKANPGLIYCFILLFSDFISCRKHASSLCACLHCRTVNLLHGRYRDLEKHVEQLKRNSSSAQAQRPVTLRDVEDGAVNLRKVGETLATLKGKQRHVMAWT